MALWDTTDFLTRVKRKAQWPTNPKLSNASILAVADEELWKFVAPLVRAAGEAYWVKRVTVPIVTGQDLYRIPSRATSGSVFDVSLVDASNNLIGRLSKVQTADIYFYAYSQSQTQTGTPQVYAVEGDQIRLIPKPGSNLSLLIRYERRPSQLVPVGDCAEVTAVGAGTLDSGTALSTTTVDVAQSRPNFDALYDDAEVSQSGFGPTTYTFASGDVTQASVGDYICLPGQTCIVPVPDALYPIFIDRVASECLDEAGDAAGAERVRAQLERSLPGVMETIQPRAETSAPALFNRWSPMRAG